MPSYTCTTATGRLDDTQRRRIVEVITDAHHTRTGAPRYFVRVGFTEVDADSVFVGGAPLDHDHLFVFGHIRGGRDEATRRGLIDDIVAGVTGAADMGHLGVWVYLAELEAANMVEFGHGLPPSGGEAAWRDGLSTDDRAWMESLGE